MEPSNWTPRCLVLLSLIASILARTSPPTIFRQPDKLRFYQLKESVELPCEAESEPAPKYYWRKNAQPFDPNGMGNRITQQLNKGTIVFNQPLKEDEGVYQCFAQNAYGTAATVTTIMLKAVLEPFQKEYKPRVYKAKLGGSLKLTCTSPESFPPAQIFWAAISPESGLRQLIMDDRITIDDEGNLYFTNLKKEDQLAPGSKYACIAQNRVMRSFVEGYYSEVRVTGTGDGNGDSALVTNAYTTPSPNRVAIAGEVFRLRCIYYGNPTPKVKWIRQQPIGAPMPPEPYVYFDGYGHEIVFNDIRVQDAGTYQCQGTNEITANPVTYSYTITVNERPRWLEKPTDVNAAEEETVQFRCKAVGNPSVKTEWFVNGIPIVALPPNPRRIVEKNILTFINLTKADAQVIQCNVSNDIGYEYTNAYLNVLAEAPSFVRRPERNVKVAENSERNMTCETFGAPTPRVTWRKDGNTLTGGRFHVFRNGNLRITNIIATDAGNYSCTAKNKFGEVSDWGTLVVRQATRIVEAPQDLRIVEGEEAKFVCKAVTDPQEVSSLVIDWKKNNQFINYALEQRVFKNMLDDSLTVSGTRVLDTAMYTCVASNGLDTAEASAYLTIQGRPNPPKISEVRCQGNTAVVKWESTGNNYTPLLGFNIQYNTNFDINTFTIIYPNNMPLTEQKLVPPRQTEGTVTLSPYATYKFRVVAVNRIGASDPSLISEESCKTEPDVPFNNPEFVRGEGDQNNNMIIIWSIIPDIEQNAPGFRYRIKWECVQEKGNECDKTKYPQTLKGSREVTNSLIDKLIINPLPFFTKFNITVMSVNAKGDCKVEPKPVIGYSGEDMPTVTVENVQINPDYPVTDKTVHLTWNKVNTDRTIIKGFFVGYRVEYYKEGNPKIGGSTDIVVNTNTNNKRRRRRAVDNLMEAVVTDLPPYSRVVITVMVINKRYSGPKSTPLIVQTQEGVPSQVRQFRIVQKTANTLEFRWGLPENPNGVLLGYDIGYAEIIGLQVGETNWIRTITDVNQKEGLVSGLKPNTMYRVYIYAVTKVGRGEEDFLDAITHPPGPPQPPTFSIHSVGEFVMNVTWVPSSSGNPGSVFYVQYRKLGVNNWMATPKVKYQNWFNVSNLDPGVKYEVRVVAVNGMNEEAKSGIRTVQMAGYSPYTSSIATATWFIIMMIIIALLIIVLIIICVIKRNRGGKYPVQKEAIDRGFITHDQYYNPHQNERLLEEPTI